MLAVLLIPRPLIRPLIRRQGNGMHTSVHVQWHSAASDYLTHRLHDSEPSYMVHEAWQLPRQLLRHSGSPQETGC